MFYKNLSSHSGAHDVSFLGYNMILNGKYVRKSVSELQIQIVTYIF